MTTFLIEAYVGRVGPTAFGRLVARMDEGARSTSRSGSRAFVLRTILLPGDETCLCLIAAGEADAAHSIARIARLQPQRVIEVLTLGPPSLEMRPWSR